jgi:hypothetical protein
VREIINHQDVLHPRRPLERKRAVA